MVQMFLMVVAGKNMLLIIYFSLTFIQVEDEMRMVTIYFYLFDQTTKRFSLLSYNCVL